MKTFILIALLLSLPAQAAEVGEEAPQCPDVIHTDQTKLDLSKYRGKVVLLDFWATWCPPCKKSMPFLNQLHHDHDARDFEVVAINVDENSEEARQFLSTYPVDYSITFDPSGTCPPIFDLKAMPSSYLIDQSGVIRQIHLGFRDEDKGILEEQINNLLAP